MKMMCFYKCSFNVISDYIINIIEGGKEQLISFCEMHTYSIYIIFDFQNSIRINVTTLKDDGEVSKEQVCLL